MKGSVYLVGAGPGDLDLITVRGLGLIQKADVIVYDQLINIKLLEDSKSDCKHIYVGKIAGNHAMSQEKMNDLLIELSETHKIIVRLKGGDPYVFGRGSEEGEALYHNGVPFEVVPGITSPIGGLAYAGIPITSRGIATSFHVITGHVSEGSDLVDFEALSKLKGTLVFLMGMSNLELIVKGLMDFGKDYGTPVAIIYRATTPFQKVVVGTLDTIVKVSAEAQMTSPSLIVVGEVVKHREALNFFEKRPLFGKKIMVTRSRANASKLSSALERLGAMVKEVPTIMTVPINVEMLEAAMVELSNYSVIIFTSGVAVTTFFDKMKELRIDGRRLGHAKLIVIGSETAKTLESYGCFADEVPDVYSKVGLSGLLEAKLLNKDHLLIPRSKKGDHNWMVALSKKYKVTELPIYDTVFLEANKTLITELENDPIDYITFTSSSTALGLENLLGASFKDITGRSKICAIGPTTRGTLVGQGIKVDLQPERYTIQDMIDCIVTDTTKED
jgi:uroporphyrinogen III methyltransferase/synthase